MPTPLDRLEPRHIALIKPSALGDIVHALPVLTALRCRFPNARITWVVNRSYEPLLTGHPHLDATLAFDRGGLRRGLFAGARAAFDLAARLRAERFDLVLDLQGLMRSGLMCLATRAARRVGLATAREGASWCYTDVVPVDRAAVPHAVDRQWRVAEALGATGLKQWVVPISDEARAWADAALAGLPRPWLLLGVGARWQTKRWPAGHFAALVRRSQALHGGAAVFVGSAEDAPAARQAAAELAGPWRDFSGRTTLPQLAALLARADVVLANDTGPLHLAAALGRPVVAPYTCTRVPRHGPYGQADRAVATAVPCAGSYLKKCRKMVCMGELTPDRLWPVLAGHLAGWTARSA
jgi:heptosyltransferase-1